MKIRIEIQGKSYEAWLDSGYDISILVGDEKSPIAFGAPPLEIKPYSSGNYVGSLEAGSPVNFYNLKINPHGNMTHTETARHITNDAPEVGRLLKRNHFIARLITVFTEKDHSGYNKIGFTSCEWESFNWEDIEALVIRSMPNPESKKSRNYTGKNPTYVDNELMGWLTRKIDHLLVDVPSVDPEKDDGKLEGHRAFWSLQNKKAFQKTITELVFVDTHIDDGLYLLNLQTLALMTDASPSRPVLYPLKPL